MTLEKCKEKVKELEGDKYLIINAPENFRNTEKIKFYHKSCKKEYDGNIKNFLRGRRCPYCFGTPKKTTEQVKSLLFQVVKNEYSLLSEYNGCNKKIILQHNLCGNIFETTYSRFFGKKEYGLSTRCPHCFGTPKKTTDKFKKEIEELVGNEYSVLSEYDGNKKNILFKHKDCGQSFEMRAQNFLHGARCPICGSSSKGETKILKYFEEKSINFISQKRFKDCKRKRSLPFDFMVMDKNNNLLFLLEYNGIQHYQEENKSPFAIEKLKENDKIKKISVKKKNYLL